MYDTDLDELRGNNKEIMGREGGSKKKKGNKGVKRGLRRNV